MGLHSQQSKSFVFDLRGQESLEAIHSRVQEVFQGQQLHLRDQLGLNSEFFPLVASGSKTTTVRFAKGGQIHFPLYPSLPLVISNTQEEKGKVVIAQVEIKNYASLTENDAHLDGFASKQELLDVLLRIYGPIAENELVSIYSFVFQPHTITF
jgi:hypothetical protein